MADDYGNIIPVTILTSPILLDETAMFSNHRFVLGYLVMVYKIDNDAEMTIYVKKNNDMDYEAVSKITVASGKKRIYRKLPLDIGAVMDFYIKFTGDFKDLTITTLKILVKNKIVGKHS